jgi:hypothetical protein
MNISEYCGTIVLHELTGVINMQHKLTCTIPDISAKAISIQIMTS